MGSSEVNLPMALITGIAYTKNNSNYRKRWKYRCGCNCECARRHKSSFVIPPLPDDYFQPPPSYYEAVKKTPRIINGILPKPKFFSPPKISWPSEDKFNGLYLGTDVDSRVILRFNDELSIESYSQARKTWSVYFVTLGKETVIALEDLEIGMFVIVNDKMEDRDHFIRAKVLFVNFDENWAKVLNVDEWEVLTVKRGNIFWMNQYFLTVHFQAIVCDIDGFSFLTDGPILKMIMDEPLIEVFPPKSIIHVDKLQVKQPYPSVSFSKWPCQLKKTMISEEMKSIIVNWSPKLPKGGKVLEHVLISHGDELGYVWLQVYSALTYFLTHLDNPLSKYHGRQINVDIKTDIEYGETIFLGLFLDQIWYRVKLIEFFPDQEKALVEFIDFGNRSTISLNDMLPCEILVGNESSVFKSIEPQCVKAHLKFVDLINLDYLWHCAPIENRIDVMVSFKQRPQRIARQVELYTYVDEEKRTQSLNEYFVSKFYARNVGRRKIGLNMRVPLTLTFISQDLLDRAEEDIPKKITEDGDDFMYIGIKYLFREENYQEF